MTDQINDILQKLGTDVEKEADTLAARISTELQDLHQRWSAALQQQQSEPQTTPPPVPSQQTPPEIPDEEADEPGKWGVDAPWEEPREKRATRKRFSPKWKGLRGLGRWLWKGHSPDNPDYAHLYQNENRIISLRDYLELDEIINDLTEEIVGYHKIQEGLEFSNHITNFKNTVRQLVLNAKKQIDKINLSTKKTQIAPDETTPDEYKSAFDSPSGPVGGPKIQMPDDEEPEQQELPDTSDDEPELPEPSIDDFKDAPGKDDIEEPQEDLPSVTTPSEAPKSASDVSRTIPHKYRNQLLKKEIKEPDESWLKSETSGNLYASYNHPALTWMISQGVNIFDENEVAKALEEKGLKTNGKVLSSYFKNLKLGEIGEDKERQEKILRQLGWRNGIQEIISKRTEDIEQGETGPQRGPVNLSNFGTLNFDKPDEDNTPDDQQGLAPDDQQGLASDDTSDKNDEEHEKFLKSVFGDYDKEPEEESAEESAEEEPAEEPNLTDLISKEEPKEDGDFAPNTPENKLKTFLKHVDDLNYSEKDKEEIKDYVSSNFVQKEDESEEDYTKRVNDNLHAYYDLIIKQHENPSDIPMHRQEESVKLCNPNVLNKISTKNMNFSELKEYYLNKIKN